MIEKLKECHRIEREQSIHKQCTMDDMTYALAPLYKRGLIEVRKSEVENKTKYCIYLTQAGKSYLKNLED